jgi:hypothetical protein
MAAGLYTGSGSPASVEGDADLFWRNREVMDEYRNRGSLDEVLIGIVSDKDFADPANVVGTKAGIPHA